jgi:broad specificity phosphatase PhoE
MAGWGLIARNTVYFITHPDVGIDPAVPIPDWPLNERGRARMSALLARPWVRDIRAVFTSSERKARDGAEILAGGLGLDGYETVEDLDEKDRSSTGFLLRGEFEAMVDAFFAQPETRIRGWEPAADAQKRIIRVVEHILSIAPAGGDLANIGHGGTGTLLYCSLARLPISRQYDQPPTNGGNWFAFDRDSKKLRFRCWQSIDGPVV